MKISKKFERGKPIAVSRQILRIMKLTIVIMIACLLQVGATTKAQITLKIRSESMQRVLENISKQSGYDFVYSTSDLKELKATNIDLNNVTMETALKACFANQPLQYEIADKTVMIKRKADPTFLERLADRWAAIDVHGRVVDQDGKPLQGATVKVKGTGRAVSTDVNGRFELKGVDENATLQISFIGYIAREILAKEDLGSILLLLGNSDLQEVVINKGYYKESKLASTGNVGSISAKDIEKQNVNNPILALQGWIPGVEVSQVNGIPGGAINISIRGINTFEQSRSPLFIIDGVPYVPNLYQASSGFQGLNSISGGVGINPFSLINPKDIESIDVLKDADATAIYGSRGSNGVVLITTKKGKAGTTKVDLNFEKGFGRVAKKANLLNTQEYLEMRSEAFQNDNITPNINNAKDLIAWDQNAYTDWQKVLIGNTSDYTNTQASVSGGNNITQFLIGGNYSRETTVFPGDWHDDKASVHFNINSQSNNQKFKVLLSGSFLADNNQLPTVDFSQSITTAPNAPSFYLENGKLDWSNYSFNPLADAVKRYTAKTQNLVGNSVLSYNILPGVEVKASLGYNSILLKENTTSPISSYNPTRGIKTGSAGFNTTLLKSWIFEPQINYQAQIAGGSLKVLIGGTIQRRQTDGQLIYGLEYTDDGMLGSLAAAKTIIKGQSINEEYKYSSFFGRLNYNWKEKYLVNLTARRDGSSRFGPGRQYGNFGAIGAAWIFSQENFFKELSPVITSGKLRVSYGTTGNEPRTNYAFLELYSFSSSLPYGGSLGIRPTGLPNADYRWEINRKAELGLELGFLNDRITFSTSIYQNRSSNQLINGPLPFSVGFPGVISNLPATIQNSGLEFTANSTNIKSANFKWNSGFNISVTRNKLLSFPDFEVSGYENTFTIGKPINARRMFLPAGIDPTTGRYQFYDKEGNTTSSPVAPADAYTLINILPKFSGGFQNTFTYKSFSLDLNFYFVNQTGINYLFANSIPPGFFQSSDGKGNQPKEVLERWTKESPAKTLQGFTQDISGFFTYATAKNSSLVLSDASFIRLRNSSLSYQLPKWLTEKLRIQNLKFFVQGQNLLTITTYKGADPETQNMNVLPPLRVITTGIQLTL